MANTSRRRRRRIPFVMQMEAVECGAACLTMALRTFGHHAELSELREACGVSRDGVSAKQIVRVARLYGLVPNARRLEPADLANVVGPAVLHWEMNHFVLLERWQPDEVSILDPAIGPRRISADEFDRSFTGICIELEPGKDFRKKAPERASLARYAALLGGARPALAVLAGTALLLNVLGLTVPLTAQAILDHVIAAGRVSWLTAIGGASVALVLLLFATHLLRGWLLGRVRAHVDAAMTRDLAAHLFRLPVRFFTQRHTADLVARVDAVRFVREIAAERAVTLFVDVPLLVTYVALLLRYDSRMGAVVLGAAAVQVGVFLAARGRQLAAYRERTIKDVKAGIALLQIVRGATTLKASGRELHAHEKWLRLFVHALNAAVKETRLRVGAEAVLFAARMLGPTLAVTVGARLVIRGELSIGELFGFSLVALAFLAPLESAMTALLAVQQLPIHLARIDDVLKTAPEVSGARDCPPLSGEVSFEDVTFRYGPTAPPTLDKLSFRVRAGEKVALVGPSGSGKSTVARLLLGLYAPESGRIALDGNDLADLDLDSARGQMGVVLQETALFDGTVRDNLTLYHPSASLEQVVAATRAAQIHSEIDGLPAGYETALGSQGGPFSGGQRQRLALARAVIHRPRVMVLDEATSALDTGTEAAVDAYLSSRACTRIVIAHRLATVRDADRIIVLVDGRVVEEGRHEALLAAGGQYAKLVAHGERAPNSTSARAAAASTITAHDFAAVAGLGDLSESDRATLATLATRRVAPEDAILIGQGDRAPGLFVVVRGELEVVLEEPGLERRVVGKVSDGALLGEVSLLDGSAASASLIVSKRSDVIHIPAPELERLRSDGDTLAVRLTFALGKLVAQRLREKTIEREKLGPANTAATGAGATPQSSSSAALRLDQTALGASLLKSDLARFEGLGELRVLGAGETLFAQGAAAGASYLVLGGRVGVFLDGVKEPINIVKPGELLGEIALFDPGPRTAGCTALESCTVFSIDHERLRAELVQGDAMAAKVLRHLTYSLVKAFRISDLRLREAIAGRDGEDARARSAREQARALDASRDLSMTAHDVDARVPFVESDRALSAAACLCAVLRFAGRPSPFTTVAEACSDAGRVTPGSLARGARSFGFGFRAMKLEPKDLRWLVEPLILELEGGLFVVAEGWDGATLLTMSPTEGRRRMTREEVARCFTGTAYEARGSDVDVGASLFVRLRAVLGKLGTVRRVVGTALGIQLLSLAPGLALSILVGTAIPHGDLALVQVVLLSLTAFGIASAVLHALRGMGLSYMRTSLDRALLDQLVRHVISLRIEFFERRSPGSILARFEAFRIVRDVVGNQGLAAIIDAPLLLISLAAVALVDAKTAGLGLVALALESVLMTAFVPRLRKLAHDELNQGAAQRSRLIEVLSGIVTLRAVGAAEIALRRFLPSAERTLRTTGAQDALGSSWLACAELVRLGTIALATWWGASRVLGGDLTLSALLSANALLATALFSAREIGGYAIAYSRAATRVALLDETFAEPPEQRAERLLQPGRLRGRIELEGVSFAYDKDSGDVLSEVSITIEPGTKVALVGGSGSGKSTLGKLLLGFYVPRRGRILFDGRDLANLDLQAVRGQVGVVLQDAQLFAGSVRENIAISAPDSDVETVIEAAKMADIHDTIVELPMGYETVMAEGGSSFSGGQRQRLAIARALVHKPSVLLLDEATSALDNASQSRIEQALSTFSSTRIVIAHRLSTVVNADQIVVLERGRVVEVGRHEELVAKRGAYFKLTRAELGA